MKKNQDREELLKMRRNIGFYERYKNEQKQKKIEEQFRKKYNISDDKTVVFEKKSKIDKVIFALRNFIAIILKVFVYFLIFGLSTIGATVLLNEALRMTLFEAIQTII